MCEGNAVYGWWITNIFRAWLGYEQSGRGWSSYQFMLKATSIGQNYKQFYCSDSNLYFRVDYSEVEHGNGGSYRQVNTQDPNCFGYALFLIYSPGLHFPTLGSSNTEIYSSYFAEAISHYSTSCRRINSYVDDINSNEYRLAIRAPRLPQRNYHVIYQLSDGTWAGKDDTANSQHFGRGNPSIMPEMWSNDWYPADSGTIYFAVQR